MLQIVVRAWQVRHGIAVKQSRAIAAGDLAEVGDTITQGASTVAMAGHGANHAVEAAPDRGGVLGVMVAQDVGGLMYPFVSALDVGPQRCGLLQAMPDQD